MRGNIRTRLFLLSTLSIVFVIAISMVILLFNFKDILLERAMEDQKSTIMKGASEIENIVYELDRVTLYLCGDNLIPQLLEGYQEDEIYAANFNRILQSSISVYTNYPITGSSIDYYSLLFVAEHFPSAKYLSSYSLGTYIASNRSTSTVFNSNAVKNEDWYKKTVEYNTKTYSFLLDDAKEFIFFSKLVRNGNFKKPFHNEVMGILVYCIKKNDIIDILNNAKATENTEIILAYEDTVFAGTEEDANLSGKAIPDKFSQVKLSSTNENLHKTSYKNIDYTAIHSRLTWNLELLAMIPQRDITKELNKILYIMIIELLVVMLVALFISALVSNIFTKPIMYLTGKMQKIKKEDQLVEIPQIHKSSYEVSYLYQSYNDMIKRILQLVDEIKHNLTLQKKAELKALQSQINPHFIYNTLDTVNWIALCEGQKDISVIVTSLSDIFRYSIKEPDVLVTLEEEIAHLSKYLKIQSMRYSDKFVFEMKIPEAFLTYKLPKLTIQPLVENSLLHVINSESTIHVSLLLEDSGKEVRIIVSDTGSKAIPEVINEYLMGADILQTSGEGIGIRNLNKRIKMHFGDDYGLHYERRGKNLLAVLTLPQTIFGRQVEQVDGG